MIPYSQAEAEANLKIAQELMWREKINELIKLVNHMSIADKAYLRRQLGL